MKKASIKSEDYQKYYRQLILKKIGITGQKKIFKAKILVIGAGGAARSISLSLAEQPIARVDITNRTHSRAEEAVQLVHKLGGKTKVLAIQSNDIDFHAYDMETFS